MSENLTVSRLGSGHRRSGFTCGVAVLDRYLQHQAGQDMRRNLSTCYVLCSPDSEDVLGYYTLASHALLLSSLPEEESRKLPHYDHVPAILLGRLAVHTSLAGQGHGSWLLADALKRCADFKNVVAAFGVVVDPKEQALGRFYQRAGFEHIPDTDLQLFITFKKVAQLLAK